MPVCSTGLLHLAVELIQRIGDYLLLRDLKSLRLVCSWLNNSVEPTVLSCMVLDVFGRAPSTTMHQLETLGNQRTPSRAPEFTRKLRIKSLTPRDDSSLITRCVQFLTGEPSASAVEEGIRKYLVRAISSLKRIESVIWTMDQDDTIWTRPSVCEAIVSLQFLQELQLIFQETYPPSMMIRLNVDLFFPLRRISLSGACEDYRSLIALAHMEVDYPPRLRAPPFQDFFSKLRPDSHLRLSHITRDVIQFGLDDEMLPHLRALHSLELVNIPAEGDSAGREALTKLYVALAREHIFLRCIVIDFVCPTLLDYLSSYSGSLVELHIIHLDGHIPWDELDALAERFYASVLPKHIDSLEILDISPKFACRWCFDPQDCLVLSQFQRLRSLRVTFAPNTEFWGLYPRPNEYGYGFDHAVPSMMRLTMTLQCLTYIHIEVAKPRLWRRNFFRPSCHGHDEHTRRLLLLVKQFDDIADTIRLGISNFSFPIDDELSCPPLPVIEVETRLPQEMLISNRSEPTRQQQQ